MKGTALFGEVAQGRLLEATGEEHPEGIASAVTQCGNELGICEEW